MTIKDLIIDAAEIAGRPDIYFLGPFARRVSFVSQQIRSLNLIWALHADGRIRANDRVAVIGAGIAGVTAACALRAYGCTVDIFDRARRPMWRQSAATHRMVHPSINFWPRTPELLPTTSQPFLEWYYERCSDVIGTLTEQWDEVVANCPGSLKFHGERNVLDVWRDGDRVFLHVTPGIGAIPYKTAIVATGFGNERDDPHFAALDYWRADSLETDKLSGQFSFFVISGCGDGGMIDALRVAYDFNHGRLAIDVAAALARTDIARSLAAYDRPEITITDEYEKLVGKIDKKSAYKKTRLLLAKGLDVGTSVILVDRDFGNPFNSPAAPIHKLMVAYARSRGVIRYRQGTVSRKDDGKIIVTPFGEHDADKTRVVVRHGAHLGFGQLLALTEVEEFRTKQRLLGQYNFQPAYSNYPVPDPWPKFEPKTDRFRSHRRPLAEKAIRQFGNVSKVKATLDGFEAIYTGDLSFKPKKLFKVSVAFTPEEAAPTEEPLV